MLRNAVAGTEGTQFADDGRPERGFVRWRRCQGVRSHWLYSSRNSVWLLGCGFFHCLGLLLFLLLFSYRRFPRCLQRYLGRRYATLVVAGTILQVTVDVVRRLRETYLLHELCLLLEELQFHTEHLIKLLDDVALGLKASHRLSALHLHRMERGRDGAVVAEVGTVDVPPSIYRCREHDLSLSALAWLQLGLEVNRIDHLCLQSHSRQDHQNQ